MKEKITRSSDDVFTDMMRGKWEKFSLDMLVTLPPRAGLHCELKLAA